jgi:O-antigen ligase
LGSVGWFVVLDYTDVAAARVWDSATARGETSRKVRAVRSLKDRSDQVARDQTRLARWAAWSFVLGTLTWRTRSASELSETPVDSAASVRLLFDALSLALALLCLLNEPLMSSQVRPRPKKLLPGAAVAYLVYILAGVLGVLVAVDPQIVTFRLFELTIALIVATTLSRWLTLQEIVDFFRRVLVVLAGAIVVSALAMPSRGFVQARGGVVPIRLEGVFPAFSANSVGFVGLLLFALSLTSERYRKLGIAGGLSLVALSQYRTGYVAVAAAILVWMAASSTAGKRLALLLALPLGYLLYQSATFQSAWIRGEEASNSVATLSGRTYWWAAAFDAAERHPFIGLGLSSGTRFEVLQARLGLNEASTIHGTWVEVYVGTGILGTIALALFVLVALREGTRVRTVSLAPLLIITVTLVRSLTGTTIELASVNLLVVLMLTIAAARTSVDQVALSPPLRAKGRAAGVGATTND